MNRLLLHLLWIFGGFQLLWAQSSTTEKRIEVVYGANYAKNEALYPGASLFLKDSQRLHFRHRGADLWCDTAILYPVENKIKASGQVMLVQGDSISMQADRIDYDGAIQLAKATGSVLLKNNTMTLVSEEVFMDRAIQQAYYTQGGEIQDTQNTLTSKKGRLYMDRDQYEFSEKVHIQHPDYQVDAEKMDYWTSTKEVYFHGPSRIQGKDYDFYCEKGYYNSLIERGHGTKNTKIWYNQREIFGDSIYFDKAKSFASATQNITVLDTVNKNRIKAHYAEVYKEKDSVFATKKAVFISLVEKDSLYVHGDQLMVTGPENERIMRAFKDARFFKNGLSGRSDSIHYSQKSGITQLIRQPIVWNGNTQLTGDSIHIKAHPVTNDLDSLKVIGNAFVASLDSISNTGYNQAKGKKLNGRFINNTLDRIQLLQNTEVIYYVYDDDQELLGIDKTVCSEVWMYLKDNELEDIKFITSPDGTVTPEKEFLEEDKKLEGFQWFGSLQMKKPEDIFDISDLQWDKPKTKKG